jgi:hypothetical protein
MANKVWNNQAEAAAIDKLVKVTQKLKGVGR